MKTGNQHTKEQLTVKTLSVLLAFSLVLSHGPVLALDTGALPSGGAVSAGKGTIKTCGSTMVVNQDTANMAVNWKSYNIGAGAKVTYNQPSADSIALNRVTGSGASEIYGSLTANGRVFLLNSNGILFGENAQVNAGGLVASTLNLNDEDFMNGNYRFTGTAGSVTNKGSLTGGTIALLGGQVSNQGTITANLGTAVLASGTDITLDFAGDGLTTVTVNKGTLDALAENKSLIRADGGQVIMTAKAADSLVKSVVNNTGIIEARTVENRNGTIILLSDMDNGITQVSGTLDASAPNGGDGGFIETSAEIVTVADGTTVTTLAPNGKTGTWLIDPTDFTIESGTGSQTTSSIGADTLSTSLESNSIEIATSGSYTAGDDGDINVNAAVEWNAATTLTLTAHDDININADITADSGTLVLKYGQNSSAGTSGEYTLNNAAKVNLSEGLHFYTQQGTTGTLIEWTVITELGDDYHSVTGTDLQGINGDLAGNYVLGADIDAIATRTWTSSSISKGFSPIGASSDPFTGNFDGLGHTITDLYIWRYSTHASASHCGLFGAVKGTSTNPVNISNVGLINVDISGHAYVGGLVGRADSLINISNCYTTGTVNSYYSGVKTGGLVAAIYTAYNEGVSTIDNCYSTAAVFSCNGYAGGLVGSAQHTSINNSYSTGSVKSNTQDNNPVGGLIGELLRGTVRNCYTTGTLTADGGYLASLIGWARYGCSVYNSVYLYTDWVSGVNGDYTSSNLRSANESQMKSYDTFSSYSWDISDTGGSDAIWRIYDGYTSPLLASFLTPTTVTADNISRSYDGTTTSSGTYTTETGADTSLIRGSLEANTDKDAGTYTDAAITYAGLYSTQQGYDISYAAGTVEITPATLTVIAADNKVYDGTTTATISGDNLSGLISGDSVCLTGTFDDKNVGTNKTVSYVNTLTGTDAGNYELNITGTATTADITAKTLTVTGGTASDKIYDGTTTAIISGGTLSEIISGDDVTLLSAGNFDDKNVGTGKTVAFSLAGTDAANYEITTTTTAAITAKTLTITGTTTAANKVYDGETTATVSGAGLTGEISGDTITLLQSGTFDDKNVGIGKTVAYTNSLAGTDAGNYVLDTAGGTATADITAKTLFVTGTDADSKVYDGNTDATFSGSGLSGQVAGDTVLLVQSGNFDNKNVGTGKTVTYTNSLTGTDAANYALDVTDATATADITAKILTVAGGSADNKQYDGTTTATITGGTLSEIISGDDAVLMSTGNFNDKNAGTGKTVTFSLTGTDAGNYEISTTTFADITVATLSVNCANNKVYDGTSAATISGSSFAGLVSGDSVSLAGTFSDINAGTNIAVTYGNSLTGTDAGNYVLDVSSGTTTADITPKTLNVTGTTADNKIYDGTVAATLSNSALSGLVAGDTVSLLQSAVFADKNAGTGKTVFYTNSLAGTHAGNYVLDVTNALAAADILARTLTVTGTATADKTYDGSALATVSGGTVGGLVPGETVTLLQSGTFFDGNAGSNKTVTYTNSLGGAYASNYVLDVTGGTLSADILPAPLTIKANDYSQMANGAAYYGGNGVVYSGFVPGEKYSVLLGNLSWGGTAQGARAVGQYDISPGGLRSANYAIRYIDGTLTITTNEPYTAAVMTANQTGRPMSADFTEPGTGRQNTGQAFAAVAGGSGPSGNGGRNDYSMTIIDGGLRMPEELYR